MLFRFGLLLRAQTTAAPIALIRRHDKSSIAFTEPVEVRRIPGIRPRVKSLGIALDDPAAFERQLSAGQARLTGTPGPGCG